MRLAHILVLVVLILAGCSAHRLDQPSPVAFSGHDAITKVIALHNRPEFPAQPGKVHGIIHGGGPAPGLQIPGEFESNAVRKSEQLYTVTLTVHWSSQQFRAESDPPDATLHHYWKYEVSPSDALLIEAGGNTSPYEIE